MRPVFGVFIRLLLVREGLLFILWFVFSLRWTLLMVFVSLGFSSGMFFGVCQITPRPMAESSRRDEVVYKIVQ